MRTVSTELRTEAVYSDNGVKRYLLRKTWADSLSKLAVIMLCAGSAGAVELDTTTQLVLNNASRLGYGSVAILNLFATLNDFALKQSGSEDAENLEVIVRETGSAEKVVYAPGTGKTKNKLFMEVQKRVLLELQPYEAKLHCLCDENGGSRYLHPLSPRVREWHLSPLKICELVELPQEVVVEQKKKAKGKLPKKKQVSSKQEKSPCPNYGQGD